MENLRTIPDPLIEKAKAMGIQPWMHNSDFVFEQYLGSSKEDFGRAIQDYYEQGKNHAAVIHAWVDDYCKSLKIVHERNHVQEPLWSPKNILDFAAGYGRLARHLPLQFPNSKIQTCDIHAAAVAFNANLLMLESYQSSVTPEDLKLPQQDVIICVSLFTHLPKRTFSRWLKRLVAHLSPQGLLLFTTHGHVFYASGGLKGTEVDQEGFAFIPRSGQRDLDVADYGSTVAYPSYVLGLMSECRDRRLVRFHEGFGWWLRQDAYIFAKG